MFQKGKKVEVGFTYPSYFDELIGRLIKRDWLVHNFPSIDNVEVYNFANYKYNKLMNNVTYTLYLDVNVYQFIVNSVKKDFVKDDFKDAIALIAFCQLAEIEIEPAYAVYEKINYRTDKVLLNEITSDLELFHRINNTSNEELVLYALGMENNIVLNHEFKVEHETLQNQLTKYRRLKEWDSLYLMVLYITLTSLDDSLSKSQKLNSVVEWMVKEFRLSLVAITFASVFFGKKPLKKMMKFKASQSAENKLKSLFNMTWDLYNLNRYFRIWTERDNNDEALFASGDKAFNEILRNSVNAQNKGGLNVFGGFLSQSDIDYLEMITSEPEKYFVRVFASEQWSPEYRSILIGKYERKLGVSSIET